MFLPFTTKPGQMIYTHRFPLTTPIPRRKQKEETARSVAELKKQKQKNFEETK